MTYQSRPVTEAVLDTLSVAGLVVGDGVKPAANAGWQGEAGASTFKGYVVVHPVGSIDVDGPLDKPSDDVWPLHQITAYGANRAQCEQIADTARAAMLAGPMAITGRDACRWRVDLVGVVTRTDDVQPPIYMAPDRYTAYTTPS